MRQDDHGPNAGDLVGHAFISYAHVNTDEADRLERALTRAAIPVWRDTGSLWPGQDWRRAIRRAITDDALAFVACFSRESVARPKGYQYEELLLAVEQMRQRRPGDPWLIPVRFDDCEIPDLDIGGGQTLRSLHRADLFGDNADQAQARLIATVRWILSGDHGVDSAEGSPQAAAVQFNGGELDTPAAPVGMTASRPIRRGRKSRGKYRPRLGVAVAVVSVLIVVTGIAVIGNEPGSRCSTGCHAAHLAASPEQVQLAVPSEEVQFLNDPRVHEAFLDHGLDVQVTGFGSVQLASIDTSKYDAVVPAGWSTASKFQIGISPQQNRPEFALFWSPLAIATHQSVAECLASAGIASRDPVGLWEFRISRYLAAVRARRTWSTCADAAHLAGRIVLATPDPRCSAAGELFMAEAAYVADNNSVVNDSRAAAKVGRELAPIITAQGFMPTNTSLLFGDYLVSRTSFSPMVLIYESQFISQELTNPSALRPDMTLMYPIPNVYSRPVLIPRDALGLKVGQLVSDNPELRMLAQESFGLHVSSPKEFQEAIGSHRIFGRKIIVPTQFLEGAVPAPRILQQVINVAGSSLRGFLHEC